MNDKSILVVEDDPSIRQVIQMVLELEGYQVVTATNGKEGVDILRKCARKPDVILLDLMMPVMNGWEFLAAQKNDRDLAEIPTVVLSASGTKPAPEGATAYFEKPVEIETILKLAQTYCVSSARSASVMHAS